MRNEAIEPLCVETGSAKAGVIAEETPSAVPSAIEKTTVIDLLKIDILNSLLGLSRT